MKQPPTPTPKDESLEEWINCWLPEMDALILNGDSRSAKQRLRDIFNQANSTERQRVIDAVREIVSKIDDVRYYPSIGIDKVEWIKKSELLQKLNKLENE